MSLECVGELITNYGYVEKLYARIFADRYCSWAVPIELKCRSRDACLNMHSYINRRESRSKDRDVWLELPEPFGRALLSRGPL